MSDGFVQSVLDLVPESECAPSDVEQDFRCALQEHAFPIHYGLALELPWDSTDMIFSMEVRADCLAPSSDASDICTFFEHHPGGHTWELTESPLFGTVFSRT